MSRSGLNGSPIKVVDIGAGTGLLSCFAAEAGAKVWAIDRGKDMATLAKSIFTTNEDVLGKDSVVFVHGSSNSLPQDNSDIHTPQLIVSEIFGTDPFSENILPILKQASNDFTSGSQAPAMLPCRLRIWGALAATPADWYHRTEEACTCGVPFGEILSGFESGLLLVNLREDYSDIKLHTVPQVLAELSLTPPISVAGSNSVAAALLPEPQPLHKVLELVPPATNSKSVLQGSLCLVLWWDSDCTLEPTDDPELKISTSPEIDRGIHWTQYAYILTSEDIGEGVQEAAINGTGTVSISLRWQINRTIFDVRMHDAAGAS